MGVSLCRGSQVKGQAGRAHGHRAGQPDQPRGPGRGVGPCDPPPRLVVPPAALTPPWGPASGLLR